MNVDTNQLYWTPEDVKAAEERGERLLPLIPIVPQPQRIYEQGPRKKRKKQGKTNGKRKHIGTSKR